MHIALDFDGTYTAAPEFWRQFVHDAGLNGHRVWIVTARDGNNDGINWRVVYPYLNPPRDSAPCPVIFCDGRTKREVMKEHGIDIDIWIDDNPAAIHMRHTSFSDPEGLAAWRRQDQYRGSKLPITGESRGFENGHDAGSRPGVPRAIVAGASSTGEDLGRTSRDSRVTPEEPSVRNPGTGKNLWTQRR